MRQRRRPAYTLFELTLVVVLIVAITAMAVPGLQSLYSYYKLEAGADTIRAAWSEGRTHAVEEGRRYRFAVVPGKGNFRTAPEAPEFWQGSPPPADPNYPAYVSEGALARGVRFEFGGQSDGDAGADTVLPTGSVSPDQWVTVALFEVDGTAQEDVEIRLSNEDVGVPIVLKLRAMTGTSSRARGEAP